MSIKSIRIPSLVRALLLTCAAVSATSCGDVVRTGDSPVMLVMNSLQAARGNSASALGANLLSDVVTSTGVWNDVGSASLALVTRNVTLEPTTNNQVTISRYHVAYRRTDGRNQQGVDVPFAFDGAVTITIPVGESRAAGFEIVRHVAKVEAPLFELRSSANIINTIAEVTFYGQDQVGNDVSVTGQILIDFGNFGD